MYRGESVKSVFKTTIKDSTHFIDVRIAKMQNVKTNMVKLFISKLLIKHVRKHFLKNNKYLKVFNLNTEIELMLYHQYRKDQTT